ncbi:hypothetical protein LA080_011467 [Diaporthe eres]|nr:hypothetical protein LA080_011467 [Diaporthe eres]
MLSIAVWPSHGPEEAGDGHYRRRSAVHCQTDDSELGRKASLITAEDQEQLNKLVTIGLPQECAVLVPSLMNLVLPPLRDGGERSGDRSSSVRPLIGVSHCEIKRLEQAEILQRNIQGFVLARSWQKPIAYFRLRENASCNIPFASTGAWLGGKSRLSVPLPFGYPPAKSSRNYVTHSVLHINYPVAALAWPGREHFGVAACMCWVPRSDGQAQLAVKQLVISGGRPSQSTRAQAWSDEFLYLAFCQGSSPSDGQENTTYLPWLCIRTARTAAGNDSTRPRPARVAHVAAERRVELLWQTSTDQSSLAQNSNGEKTFPAPSIVINAIVKKKQTEV